jgi:hypothetical protein
MLLSMLPSLLRPLLLPNATWLSSLLIYTPLLLPPLANLHVTFGVRRLSLQVRVEIRCSTVGCSGGNDHTFIHTTYITLI